MRSLIVQRIAQLIVLVTLAFAVYLLLRGHDSPGGGFAAGIAATLAMLLQAIAIGFRETRRQLERIVRPAWGVGMLLAAGTGLLHTATGAPFLTHLHAGAPLAGANLVLSTALLFDLGVFLVVVGSAATSFVALAEAARW